MAGKKSSSNYRSAISGKFVTSKYGRSRPRTTVKERGGKSGSTGGRYRSAITGRFVTDRHGKASPRTTLHEK